MAVWAHKARILLAASAMLGTFAPVPVTFAQDAVPNAPLTSRQAPELRLDIPHSDAPWGPYVASKVGPPDLANSAWLDSLVNDGKLYLSLHDAIVLALENNLDIAIARYNVPIAAIDLQRTRGGGFDLGVNTGVVQNTPGAGVGGIGAASSGAGAGGTTGGAGGAGSGAAGLVQSTLGTGTAVYSFDPIITGVVNVDHQTLPQINQQIYGVPQLRTVTTNGDFVYRQAFSPGTRLKVLLYNQRLTANSPFFNLSPSLTSTFEFQLTQPLLAGFGMLPNTRYIHIARNNQKISDLAFQGQVIATVTQIENLYWDLFNAYQQEQVQERSMQFAQQSYGNAQKQFQLQAIPEMDVVRAEAEVAKRDQDLTIAKTNLQLQQLLMKNALTKNLDDPLLVAMPVIPTSQTHVEDGPAQTQVQELVTQAMQARPELEESQINLKNHQITLKTARNALLPTVNLVAYYAGNALGGQLNPNYGKGFSPGVLQRNTSTLPTGFGGVLRDAFNNSGQEYFVGGQVEIPVRNRVAKADQYRAELEYRQSQLFQQQLRKQILIEVENAQYTLEQSRARVVSATKARDLAQKTFGITQQEQKLGAGSTFQTLSAQHDLAVAESDLVSASTAFEKARVQLELTTGLTLQQNHISMEDAKTGIVRRP
ncbi:MAG TPA: TolC family protein [Acidobacteriaceae bacterium]|nr:TolC family protein [Acidobacteriaceae bacterium]